MAANELEGRVKAWLVFNVESELTDQDIERITSLIESEKVKAVEPFRQAMMNKGSHPEYHDQQVAYLKQHWPTLYNLLKELESKEEAK